MNPNTILILGPHDTFLLIDTLDYTEEVKTFIQELQRRHKEEGTKLDLGTLEEELTDKFSDIWINYLEEDEIIRI